jgi:hypothetical protein
MLCEKYKPALIEAAITGAEPAPGIRAHAESCARCAAELAQQRQLIAAIDANLHRQMNAPVPASMVHRLQAQIAQQKPPRVLNLSWLYAAGALATAAVVILFALPHMQQHKSNSRSATLSQTAQSSSERRPQIATMILKPATPEEIRRDRKQHLRRAAPPEPEVLVPPDERVALDQLIANLGARHELVAALVKPLPEKPEQPVKHIEIPDIKTAALFIAPIAEETRR